MTERILINFFTAIPQQEYPYFLDFENEHLVDVTNYTVAQLEGLFEEQSEFNFEIRRIPCMSI